MRAMTKFRITGGPRTWLKDRPSTSQGKEYNFCQSRSGRRDGHPSLVVMMLPPRPLIRPVTTCLRAVPSLNSIFRFSRPLLTSLAIRQKCTVNQILRGARIPPKWKRIRRRESPDLLNNPFKKAVAQKVYTVPPKVQTSSTPNY